MEPNNPLLDDYVLSLAPARGAARSCSCRPPRATRRPRSTLPGALRRPPLRPRAPLPVPPGARPRRPLAEIVLEQDIVYVGGGSMRNLLAIWHAHGLDDLLVQAWRAGTVLAGLSAGAMCWFEAGITRSSGPPEPIAGLGLLEGSLTVHADGEPERLPVWLGARARRHAARRLGARRRRRAAVPRRSACERAVSSRPGAGAQRVDAIAGELVRQRVDARAARRRAVPRRSAASTRPSRNCAASTACAAACSAGGFRPGSPWQVWELRREGSARVYLRPVLRGLAGLGG